MSVQKLEKGLKHRIKCSPSPTEPVCLFVCFLGSLNMGFLSPSAERNIRLLLKKR